MEQAYRLLVTALAVHGIRQADEDGNTLVPKLHTVNTLTPSQTDGTTCTQFSKETAKHKSVKVKCTEEKFASFLVAESDISCGEGGSDSRADKMHRGLSVVTHSPPDAHDDLHGDLGVGKHSLRHTQDDHQASVTDKPDNTQNKSWLDNGSKLWNQNLEKKAVSQSSCEMHERSAYNLPLRKQQKWGRPGKSAPKQLSQVNHKYSFLSKYRDQSYPSLGRTVRKRKAVLPVNANPSDIVKKKRGRPKKYKDQGQTVFACCECEFVATSRSKLTDHHHRRHKGNPVSCDLCGKIFHNQMYMLRHRSSHTGPQHCCDVCGKMFKIQKAMINHRKTHEEGYTRPVFPCKLCSKSFCSQYIVDCHVKSVHMGQKKSYLCSYCGKKFTTKHSLQEHVNAHSGIKPHVCEICGKGFSYDSALRDHKFTHDDVKQFKCDLCNKSFCQRSGLKMHMRIHRDTKQFQCQECGREFTQKQALQRHERVHKGVKPFTCKLCSRSFTDASIIRRHLTLVHKIYKDAKTWREDITCTIKPDMQYHVSYVGLREPEPEPERAQVNRSQTEARTLLQCKAQSGRDTNRNSLPGQDLRNSAVPLPASLNSVCADSESVYGTSEGRGPSSTHHSQPGTLSVSAHTQAMSAAPQTLFQNSGYHLQPQPPSSSCMEMPCSDAELSLASVTTALNHTAAAAVSRQGLFDASIPSHSNYTAAVSSGRQGFVEVVVSSQGSHAATATARRPGLIDVGSPLYSMDKARQEVSSLHANSSYSTSVHPAFPHGPFVQVQCSIRSDKVSVCTCFFSRLVTGMLVWQESPVWCMCVYKVFIITINV